MEGTNVRAGDKLCELDTEALTAELGVARRVAKWCQDRTDSFVSNRPSGAQWPESIEHLLELEAIANDNVERIRSLIDAAIVISPTDGIVRDLAVAQGRQCKSGELLMKIEPVDRTRQIQK